MRRRGAAELSDEGRQMDPTGLYEGIICESLRMIGMVVMIGYPN